MCGIKDGFSTRNETKAITNGTPTCHSHESGNPVLNNYRFLLPQE